MKKNEVIKMLETARGHPKERVPADIWEYAVDFALAFLNKVDDCEEA